MKYIKLFEEFINESGNSIEDAQPISQADVMPTALWVEKNVLQKIGLVGLDDDAAIIGSAGKKLSDQTSGDIDIAVSVDKIAAELGVSIQTALFALNDKLKSMGMSTKMAPGFNQVSIGAPIAGDPKNGVVQVDLMLSTDLDWSRFIYHAPDFRIAESRYKGAHRNLLLMAAIGQSFKKIVSQTDTGETKEFEAYVVRLNQGIVQVRKSFEGKKGLLKNAALLKDYDKFVTNTPQQVVELLLTGKHTPRDLDTYEKTKDLIESSDFRFPEMRTAIYKDFEQKVIDSKLPVPEDLPR